MAKFQENQESYLKNTEANNTMMLRRQENQEVEINYEALGYDRMGFKTDAPRFQKELIDFRNVKQGEDVIVHPANIMPGTILRGALAARAKASPIILQTSDAGIYQVASAISRETANLLAAVMSSGSQVIVDGWWLYEEFPLRDRRQVRSSSNSAKGVAIDAEYVYFAESNLLFKIPHDFSSITQLSPSGSAIPAINGLASDGTSLYTVNWDSGISKTRFYKITISGNYYSWLEIGQLSFRVDKIGCWAGKYFIGHNSANYKLEEWEGDGTLWREIPYNEENFMGALIFNRFIYIAIKLGSTNLVQLLPLRI